VDRASNSWLVYWRDFFYDRSKTGPKVYGIIYHTRVRWFYESVARDDDIWLVINREDRIRKAWHLAMRLRVGKKRVDHRNYRPYRLVPDPASSEIFCLDHQPDMEPLLRRLRFRSGRTLKVSGRFIGRALQTPRWLSEDDALRLVRWSSNLSTLW